MNITEFRKKYPEYDDLDDIELSENLHSKYYSDMPFAEFANKFGVNAEISTITGKPINTGPQIKAAGSVSQKIAREAPALIGDLAMMAVPTPLGKLKPVTKLGKLGVGAAKLLFKSGMSAIGGGAGEGIAQKAFGEKFDLGKIGTQAAMGAGSELLFPLFKFGAKGMKVLEDITVGGRIAKGFLRDKIEKKGMQRAEKFISENAPDVVKAMDEAGDVGKAMELALDENKIIYQKFKDGIQAAQDANGEIYLNDTVNYLMNKFQSYQAKGMTPLKSEIEVMKELGYTGNMRKVLRQVMNGDPIDPADFEWIFYNWNPKSYSKFEKGLIPSVKKTRKELKDIMLNDIDNMAGGTGEAKRIADATHGAVMEYKNLKDIFTKNIVDTERGTAFYPERLGKNLMKQKTRVGAKDPALWAKIEQEANYYLELSKKLKESKVESIPGASISGGGVGYLLGGPEGAAAAETIGTISALGTMSDTMANLILGTGKGALKIGAHGAGSVVNME